jgi:hypothetical protein
VVKVLNIKEEFEREPSRGLARVGGDPRKVVGVEALLHWTYQAQAADAVTRRVVAGLGPVGYRSGLVAVERNGLLGVRIDCAGAGNVVSGELHPDAERVHDAVCSLGAEQIGLVISHAKGGTRPDWMPGARPRPLPVLRGNGKPIIEYDNNRRPWRCPLRWDPDPDHVEFMRGVWTLWWDAMDTLAERLEGLVEHKVLGLELSRIPWLDSAKKS